MSASRTSPSAIPSSWLRASRQVPTMISGCPLLLYWITYTWLMTHRGRIGDDPTVFAVRDRVSLVLILLMLVTMIAAS